MVSTSPKEREKIYYVIGIIALGLLLFAVIYSRSPSLTANSPPSGTNEAQSTVSPDVVETPNSENSPAVDPDSGKNKYSLAINFAGAQDFTAAISTLREIEATDPYYKRSRKKIDEYDQIQFQRSLASKIRYREVLKNPFKYSKAYINWLGKIDSITELNGVSYIKIESYENGLPIGYAFEVIFIGSIDAVVQDYLQVLGQIRLSTEIDKSKTLSIPDALYWVEANRVGKIPVR